MNDDLAGVEQEVIVMYDCPIDLMVNSAKSPMGLLSSTILFHGARIPRSETNLTYTYQEFSTFDMPSVP